jgi:5-methylcytosine-specific restriction endonuclease McrA
MARKAKISEKVRAAVLARDNYICRACGFGGSANHAGFLDCDHIVAESRGGKNTLDNLQCLCKVCNGAKGDRFDRQFAIRSASQPEAVWAFNHKVMGSAFAANTESDLSARLRKIK